MRAGDLHQLVLGREVDQPLDEVEAHAAHAGGVQALQLVVADAALDGGHAARLAAAGQAGIDHRAVVGAVAGGLHDHVARKAEVVAQREQLLLATRRRACTCARARTGNSAPGPNTWQCASTAPGGQLEARLRRAGVPVEPAGGLGERRHVRSFLFIGFRWARMRSASVRQSALRAKPGAALGAEQAGVGQVGHPGLALGGAAAPTTA